MAKNYFNNIIQNGVLNTLKSQGTSFSREEYLDGVAKNSLFARTFKSTNTQPQTLSLWDSFKNVFKPTPVKPVAPPAITVTPPVPPTTQVEKPPIVSPPKEKKPITPPVVSTTTNLEDALKNDQKDASIWQSLSYESVNKFITDRVKAIPLPESAKRQPQFGQSAAAQRFTEEGKKAIQPIARLGELFGTGFIGGAMPLPSAAEVATNKTNPQGWAEKAVFTTGETIGAIITLGNLSKIAEKTIVPFFNPLIKKIAASDAIKGLASNFPKIYNLLVGKGGVEELLKETFKILPSFDAYNQLTTSLNTPGSDRLRLALRSVPDALFFSRASMMTNIPAMISSQAAFGYASTRLSGGSQEDALLPAGIMGGLGAWQAVNLKEKEMGEKLMEQAEAELAKMPVALTEGKALSEGVTTKIEIKPSSITDGQIKEVFDRLKNLTQSGRAYVFSSERPEIKEIAFKDQREMFANGDHQGIADSMATKVDGVFKRIGIEADVTPVYGNYGEPEGSVFVKVGKVDPLTEYTIAGLTKYMGQDSLLSIDNSQTAKKNHPNLVVELKSSLPDNEAKNKLSLAINKASGGQFSGSSILDDKTFSISYVPEYSNITSKQAEQFFKDLTDNLANYGFDVAKSDIYFSNNSLIKRTAEMPTDKTYDQRIAINRKKINFSRYGNEKTFLQGLGKLLVERGGLSPDRLIQAFTEAGGDLISFPAGINERITESNKETLKNLNAETVVARMLENKTKNLEDLMKRDMLPEGEEWTDYKLSKEIEDIFAQNQVLSEKDIADGFINIQTKGRLKLEDQTSAFFDKLVMMDLFTSDIANASLAERIALLKKYFPDEKSANDYFLKAKEALLNGEDMSGFIRSMVLSPEDMSRLTGVVEAYIKQDKGLEGFISSLTGKDALKSNGRQLGSIMNEANDIARQYGYTDVKTMFENMKLSAPEAFDEIDRRQLAADLATAEIKDKVSYNFVGAKAYDDSAPDFWKKTDIVSESDVPKKLMGQQSILEDLVDKLNVSLRRAKLPKGVMGRAVADKMIEQKQFDTEVALHESGHIIDSAFNIVKNIPPEMINGISKEIAPLLEGQPADRQNLKEGFAYFMTDYILGSKVESKYPMTIDFLDSYMKAKAPEIMDSINIAKQRFYDLINAPTLAAAAAEIYDASDAKIIDAVKDGVKNYNVTFDKFKKWARDFYRQNFKILGYAKDLDADWSRPMTDSVHFKFYTLNDRRMGLEESMLGGDGIPDFKEWNDLSVKYPDLKFANNGDTLAKIKKDIPVEHEEHWSVYQLAKESLRRYELATKEGREYRVNPMFSPERSLDIIQQVTRQWPQVEAFSKRMKSWYEAIRQYYVDAGLITPEMKQKMDANPIYAHLIREGNFFDNDFQTIKNYNETINKSGLGGSTRPFIDPDQANIMEVMGLARRTTQNEILANLYETAGRMPNRLVSRVAPEVRPVEMTVDEALKILEAAHPEDFDIYKDEWTKTLEENPELLKIWRPSIIQEDLVPVYIEGERHYLRVDPNLQDALGMGKVGSKRDMGGGFFRFCQYVTKIKRAMSTIYSVDFGIRNPIRDSGSAWFQADRTMIPGWGQIKGIKSMISKDNVYKQGKRWGLSNATIVGDDINETFKNIRQVSKKLPVGKMEGFLNFVQRFSGTGEMMTRYGVLNNYDVNNPEEIIKGIYDAREATFNWEQKGLSESSLVKWNKYAAFFKAHYIVLEKQLTTLAQKPLKTLIKGLPLLGLSLFFANKYKDDVEYQNLPVWRRLMTLNFKVGDRWLFLPLPDIYGILFYSLPQFFYSEAQKRDPYLAEQFLSQSIKQVNPFSVGDLIPDVAKPVVEGMLNVNLFTNQPLVPTYLQGLATEEQIQNTTSESAIAISKALGSMGIDISPIKIDAFNRGYLTSAADAVNSIVNASIDGLGLSQNEYRKQADLLTLPGLRAILHAQYAPSTEYQVSKLVDKYAQIKSVYDTFNSLKKKNIQLASDFFNEHQAELMYYPSIDAQYQGLRQYISLYQTVSKSDLPQQQKDGRLKQLKDTILQNALLVNEIIEQNFGL